MPHTLHTDTQVQILMEAVPSGPALAHSDLIVLTLGQSHQPVTPSAKHEAAGPDWQTE